MPAAESNLERKIAGILLITLLVGCLIVLRPFVSAMLWAVVLCISSWPLYKRLLGWCGQRRTFVACLMALGMILIVLLPFVIVDASLDDSISRVTAAARQWSASGPPAPPACLARAPVVDARATEQWQTVAADTGELRTQAGQLIERLAPLLLTGGLALGAGLM